MTDTVTMDDLATALRAAINTSKAHVAWWQHYPSISVGIQAQVDDWQAILDRYDAQRRGILELDLGDAMNDRDEFMWFAHIHVNKDRRDLNIQWAREANHRALHLRRQLRALGGDA